MRADSQRVESVAQTLAAEISDTAFSGLAPGGLGAKQTTDYRPCRDHLHGRGSYRERFACLCEGPGGPRRCRVDRRRNAGSRRNRGRRQRPELPGNQFRRIWPRASHRAALRSYCVGGGATRARIGARRTGSCDARLRSVRAVSLCPTRRHGSSASPNRCCGRRLSLVGSQRGGQRRKP